MWLPPSPHFFCGLLRAPAFTYNFIIFRPKRYNAWPVLPSLLCGVWQGLRFAPSNMYVPFFVVLLWGGPKRGEHAYFPPLDASLRWHSHLLQKVSLWITPLCLFLSLLSADMLMRSLVISIIIWYKRNHKMCQLLNHGVMHSTTSSGISECHVLT